MNLSFSSAQELESRAIFWSESVRPSPQIKTCWLNPQEDRLIQTESSLKMIQEIITNEYQRAGISVFGWTPCDGSENSKEVVKILIEDAQPRVSSIGCATDAPWCVRLNLQFINWPGLETVCKNSSWDSAWACHCHQEEFAKACVQNYALHEFGHVLGLVHEADHSMSECSDKTGTLGAVEWFDYDPLSIMNYCNNKTQILNKLTPSLSDVDVQTILKIYTPPPFLIGHE